MINLASRERERERNPVSPPFSHPVSFLSSLYSFPPTIILFLFHLSARYTDSNIISLSDRPSRVFRLKSDPYCHLRPARDKFFFSQWQSFTVYMAPPRSLSLPTSPHLLLILLTLEAFKLEILSADMDRKRGRERPDRGREILCTLRSKGYINKNICIPPSYFMHFRYQAFFQFSTQSSTFSTYFRSLSRKYVEKKSYRSIIEAKSSAFLFQTFACCTGMREPFATVLA